MKNTVIEINFPIDAETEQALMHEDPDIIIARMQNLTGGEVVIQIIIGVISGFGAELLKTFIIEKVKANKNAQVKIDKVIIQNIHQEINVVLDAKVNNKTPENDNEDVRRLAGGDKK